MTISVFSFLEDNLLVLALAVGFAHGLAELVKSLADLVRGAITIRGSLSSLSIDLAGVIFVKLTQVLRLAVANSPFVVFGIPLLFLVSTFVSTFFRSIITTFSGITTFAGIACIGFSFGRGLFGYWEFFIDSRFGLHNLLLVSERDDTGNGADSHVDGEELVHGASLEAVILLLHLVVVAETLEEDESLLAALFVNGGIDEVDDGGEREVDGRVFGFIEFVLDALSNENGARKVLGLAGSLKFLAPLGGFLDVILDQLVDRNVEHVVLGSKVGALSINSKSLLVVNDQDLGLEHLSKVGAESLEGHTSVDGSAVSVGDAVLDFLEDDFVVLALLAEFFLLLLIQIALDFVLGLVAGQDSLIVRLAIEEHLARSKFSLGKGQELSGRLVGVAVKDVTEVLTGSAVFLNHIEDGTLNLVSFNFTFERSFGIIGVDHGLLEVLSDLLHLDDLASDHGLDDLSDLGLAREGSASKEAVVHSLAHGVLERVLVPLAHGLKLALLLEDGVQVGNGQVAGNLNSLFGLVGRSIKNALDSAAILLEEVSLLGREREVHKQEFVVAGAAGEDNSLDHLNDVDGFGVGWLLGHAQIAAELSATALLALTKNINVNKFVAVLANELILDLSVLALGLLRKAIAAVNNLGLNHLAEGSESGREFLLGVNNTQVGGLLQVGNKGNATFLELLDLL